VQLSRHVGQFADTADIAQQGVVDGREDDVQRRGAEQDQRGAGAQGLQIGGGEEGDGQVVGAQARRVHQRRLVEDGDPGQGGQPVQMAGERRGVRLDRDLAELREGLAGRLQILAVLLGGQLALIAQRLVEDDDPQGIAGGAGRPRGGVVRGAQQGRVVAVAQGAGDVDDRIGVRRAVQQVVGGGGPPDAHRRGSGGAVVPVLVADAGRERLVVEVQVPVLDEHHREGLGEGTGDAAAALRLVVEKDQPVDALALHEGGHPGARLLQELRVGEGLLLAEQVVHPDAVEPGRGLLLDPPADITAEIGGDRHEGVVPCSGGAHDLRGEAHPVAVFDEHGDTHRQPAQSEAQVPEGHRLFGPRRRYAGAPSSTYRDVMISCRSSHGPRRLVREEKMNGKCDRARISFRSFSRHRELAVRLPGAGADVTA
jgi:hypothetical protein